MVIRDREQYIILSVYFVWSKKFIDEILMKAVPSS